ncbi:MAG: hypothetical protein FWE16_04370 [Firmicutes bacterium]|nr:hypothetical protein [Bacillota bacterium]
MLRGGYLCHYLLGLPLVVFGDVVRVDIVTTVVNAVDTMIVATDIAATVVAGKVLKKAEVILGFLNSNFGMIMPLQVVLPHSRFLRI